MNSSLLPWAITYMERPLFLVIRKMEYEGWLVAYEPMDLIEATFTQSDMDMEKACGLMLDCLIANKIIDRKNYETTTTN